MAINKFFYLNNSYDKNGNRIVTGAVKLFLKPNYTTKQMSNTQTVTGVNGNERTVCNVEGSIKLDDRMVTQLKYFFGDNVALNSGDFLNVRVGVWGAMGKALSKFTLNDGDLYMFILTNAKLDTFEKKNGQTGYQLNANAFDFEPLRSAKNAAGTNQNSDKTKAGASSAAPAAAASNPSDDFAAVDESDDLPF